MTADTCVKTAAAGTRTIGNHEQRGITVCDSDGTPTPKAATSRFRRTRPPRRSLPARPGSGLPSADQPARLIVWEALRGLSHFWRVQLTDALNTPVRRRAQPRAQQRGHAHRQKPDIVFRDGEEIPREQIIVADATTLEKDYADQLKMAEDPGDHHHPPVAGKEPASSGGLLGERPRRRSVRQRQVDGFNCLPVNTRVTTKRKYVEVLCRAKIDTINTMVEDATVENRPTASAAPPVHGRASSVLEDRNPKGAEWLRSVMATNY